MGWLDRGVARLGRVRRTLAAHCAPAARLAVPLASAALGLLGCAPTVTLNQPHADVPAQFALARPDDALAQDAHAVHWRNFFQDSRLHALIEAALVHNRDLRQAAARVEEARAQWALAQAERQPSLNLLGQAQLERTLAQNLSIAPKSRLDLGLASASYELDFFGRLKHLSEAARANFLATDEARRSTELALIAQVAEIYHAQRFTEEALERSRAQVASRVQALKILEYARDIGVTDELATEEAQALLEAARAQRAQLGHALNQTSHLLRLLVGPKAADRSLPQGLPLHSLLDIPPLALGVSADVLLLRPDIIAAEQQLAAAQANIQAARAAFFPRITLSANLGTAGSSLGSLFNFGAWAFRPSLSLPLFDGGRTQAALDLARAREVAVVAQYERAVEGAFREVADQLSARESLAIQAAAAERALQAQRLRLRIHQQRQEAGMSGHLEVLEAERQQMAAEQVQMQLKRAQLDAQVGLYRALGGGAGPSETGFAARGRAQKTAAAQLPSPRD